MSKNQAWTIRELIFAALVIAFVLFMHGAVPFLMVPTLGQAVWSMGFAQSMAGGAPFDFYAHDFGVPRSAAIAFGLAGAWPASLLIRLGLQPADAYSGMVALWLGLAMFSAYRIGRRFGATRSSALLGGLTWMTMPIIWAHAGYSLLSVGIALLSYYFLAAIRLFLIEDGATTRIAPTAITLYFTATIVSVFMDGYTFMMFATGSSILLLYSFITRPAIRLPLTMIAIPIHVISFSLAYFLFSTYVGRSSFEAHSLDSFRGWGLDISFLVAPTKGVLWLPDLMNLSLKRTNGFYFGDESVWMTTFASPALVIGVLAWHHIRHQIKISTGVLIVAIFGFYMALGPSLKVNSMKPESLQLSYPREQSAQMPAEFAVIPTGNAWISENLPGFNVMRASYRWSALGIFALWLLIIICISRTERRNRAIFLLALSSITLINLPDLQKRIRAGIDYRSMFQQIDHELVDELRKYVTSGEMTAFVPWGNDFIANYLAPRVGFKTFNIGGDKNLATAQRNWPSEMNALGGELDAAKAQMAAKMLVDGTVDVVILPYFHMLWSSHLWPCVAETSAQLSVEQQESFRSLPRFLCPIDRRNELRPFVIALRDFSYLEITETSLFSTIRLRPEFAGVENRQALMREIFRKINYPISADDRFNENHYVLREGWHSPEAHRVWSQSAGKLTLPVPTDCEVKHCDAVLTFVAFGASKKRPVSVIFGSSDPMWQWNARIVATSSEAMEVKIPLLGAIRSRDILISIPNATSPLALNVSSDARVLGIALQRIDLAKY
ncbi:hypothetical protein LMG23992_02986 [Cupriavidus laharis]|uniref:Uncharacterized protein n=1 Tax=Cupriavidus laharis TaxID=151654 RepID=A0ABN7YQT0_9BURK|nr:hypothetical protein [Cupriavidus laharis]CAG9175548.1 hypothetical protein LMG23992_02986 [Cupriavidus laharis]